MNIQIQKMTLTDLNSISNILENDFDNFWNYNIFKEELECKNSVYIKAIENDEIVGFAGIKIILDEATITNIVTKNSLRNCGIGTLLLDNLINICISQKLNSITLEVNENNHIAIHLYEKKGFKNLGTRKRYYNNCDDAFIMTKSLK